MMKKISIISFTDRGGELNRSISGRLRELPEKYDIEMSFSPAGDLFKWTEKAFKGDAVIFIGAAGIAVRAIAPFIRAKDKDPAVIVMDEKGKHVIPVLSGHIGGANRLSEIVASLTGGEAVITTATDINGVFAVDSFAVEKGYTIENKERIKDVSSALLDSKEVGISVSPYLTDIFPKTLKLTKKCLVLGTGCRKNTEYEVYKAFILDFLREKNLFLSALSDLATIDIKRDEEAIVRFADEYGLKLSLYTAGELKELPDSFGFSVSEFVENETGVSNVCERSAVKRATELSLSHRVSLLEKKHAGKGITAAVAVYDPERPKKPGKHISVVGIGPGNSGCLTEDARDALENADTVIGYRVYVELAESIADLSGKEVIPSEMREERERCERARDLAEKGKRVAMVCSGDSGIYGMAGLLLEVCKGHEDIDTEIIPGITAALGGAAILGAPLTNDFAVISLSDHLTPMDTILKRVKYAAEGDMTMVLYNPKSRMRPDNLSRACELIKESVKGDPVCGYVKNIGREGQVSKVFTLGEMPFQEIDMFTTVFIGNSDTEIISGKMVTKRGYGL